MSNIMSIIFICAALLLSLLYTKPTYSGFTGSKEFGQMTISELRSEKVKYEEALQKTREIEEVRSGLQTRFNSLTPEQVDHLNKMLPDGVDSVRLIVDMDNAARSLGLSMRNIKVTDPNELRSVDPNAPANPGIYSFMNVNFEVEGEYDSLSSFLKALGQSLRLIDVVKVNISPVLPKSVEKQSAKAKQTYEMRVLIKAYYLI